MTTQEVVTIVEVLSPANKRAVRGRDAYLQKRERLLGSSTHLVEIDLLCTGEPMPMAGALRDLDYRIVVSRQGRRPHADLYMFTVREPIPGFALPLKPQSSEPIVQLNLLLEQVMERAGSSVVLDYHQPPMPAMKPEDESWLNECSFTEGSPKQTFQQKWRSQQFNTNCDIP